MFSHQACKYRRREKFQSRHATKNSSAFCVNCILQEAVVQGVDRMFTAQSNEMGAACIGSILFNYPSPPPEREETRKTEK
jgi:hypothetical protein